MKARVGAPREASCARAEAMRVTVSRAGRVAVWDAAASAGGGRAGRRGALCEPPSSSEESEASGSRMRLVVAEGNPQHQGRDRQLDESSQHDDPDPHRHLLADGTTGLCDRVAAASWKAWPRRSPTAGAARGWSPGVSRWRVSVERRSPGGVLGAPGARLRRPLGEAGAARARACGARRQSHRAHVHGGSLGRLPLQRAVAGRRGEPARLACARRRAAAQRGWVDGGCPLRPAGEPPVPAGARALPALEPARARAAEAGAA